MISITAGSVSFAQTGNEKRSAFHLSFFPPLSTNGKNAVDYTNSASISLLVGVSKNETTFSLAGLATIVKNDAHGFQLAGLLNYTGNNGSGFMFSGLANIVRNDYRGLQFAGLVNTAGKLGGFQFGGLGNVAGDVSGFQFGGLFNVARRVSGVQFAGLVNVAQSSDCPIAILNFIKEGEYSVGVSYNETGSAMLTFRSGGRVTYGILGVGYNHKTKDDGVVTEAGLGAHINILKWLRINNEIKGGSIGSFSSTDTFYTNYALLPAFRAGRHFEVFGGPSINYMQTDNIANKNMFPGNSLWKKHADSKLQQLYIGWQAGVQFVF